MTLDSTAGPSRFTGHILENRMEGTAHDLQLSWSALKTGVLDEEDEKKEEKENRSELSVFYPDRKSTRLNSSHALISYAVFCLKKKN